MDMWVPLLRTALGLLWDAYGALFVDDYLGGAYGVLMWKTTIFLGRLLGPNVEDNFRGAHGVLMWKTTSCGVY